MGKADDVTAAEAQAANKRAEATAVLMVKKPHWHASHTPQDQTLLCYTRCPKGGTRGPRAGDPCLATSGHVPQCLWATLLRNIS